MKVLKTQFEVKYELILDFQDRIIPIVTTLQRAGGVLMHPVIPEGRFVLEYQGDGYLIEIRDDRIVFATINDFEKMIATSGPFLHFVNALDKIQNLDSFSYIKNKLLAKWAIVENSKDYETNKKEFISTHIAERVLDCEIKDIAIVYDFKQSDTIDGKLTYGPFDKAKDTVNGVLSKEVKMENEINGTFLELLLIERSKEFDLTVARHINDESLKIFKNCNIKS